MSSEILVKCTEAKTHPTMLFQGGDTLPPVSLKLIRYIGLEKAIILQTIAVMEYSLKSVKLRDGNRWIRATMEELIEDKFPFMTVRTLYKYMSELERNGLIASCQPEGVISRAKYYRTSKDIYVE